ncbi:MAG: zinc ribbon domain-containing protein [Fimbriimonadaceae bacterium]|nr:zinc ribbon domain-containing protein [Fimbriimonadaceae bacterium]
MPLYEFKCRECEHTFEVRQEWKAPLPACAACGSAEVRKVYHAAALVFKGSGWHVNDYSKSGPNGGSAKAKDGESTSSPTPAASSESSASSSTASSSSASDSSSSGSGSSSSASTATTAAPAKS